MDPAAAAKSAAERNARSEEELEAYRNRQSSLLKSSALEAHTEQETAILEDMAKRRPIRRPGDVSLDVEQGRSTFAFRKLAQYNATIDLDASYGGIEEKIFEERAFRHFVSRGSSNSEVQDISDEPIAKHARLDPPSGSAGGDDTAGGNSSAFSSDQVSPKLESLPEGESSGIELTNSINAKEEIDVNAEPIPSSPPAVATAKAWTAPPPPPRDSKSPDRIQPKDEQVSPKACPAEAPPKVQFKAAPEALLKKEEHVEPAVESQSGRVDRSAINIFKQARLALISTLSAGMDLRAPHEDFLKEIHYRELKNIAALSLFVFRLSDTVNLCSKSIEKVTHADDLHEAIISMKDCQSKVESIAAALSKIPDSLARDDMIMDMDAKCALCRSSWKSLCEMHKFNYIENPCAEDCHIPTFTIFTAAGNCLAEFLIEVRKVFCDADFETPLFVWKNYFVPQEIEKDSGTSLSKTLGPENFEDRMSARRAQRKDEPSDASAGGNSSASSSSRQLSMAETFPEYPLHFWFYLPSLKGEDYWITKCACGILRFDNRKARRSGSALHRLSPTMRMKWKHFVDDLEAELYIRRYSFAGFGNALS